jgi:hypothetical protein
VAEAARAASRAVVEVAGLCKDRVDSCWPSSCPVGVDSPWSEALEEKKLYYKESNPKDFVKFTIE